MILCILSSYEKKNESATVLGSARLRTKKKTQHKSYIHSIREDHVKLGVKNLQVCSGHLRNDGVLHLRRSSETICERHRQSSRRKRVPGGPRGSNNESTGYPEAYTVRLYLPQTLLRGASLRQRQCGGREGGPRRRGPSNACRRCVSREGAGECLLAIS